MVAFLCPGMFNCLSGIGGGGQVNADASNKASIALYSTFASVSFVAGSIHNKLGTRWTLWLGSLGYCIYVAAFLSYNFNANEGFVIFAGALLGVCASLFWSAQGALMLCYPSEGNKARAISEFWVIFNLGAVIGSAIAMGLSWNSTTGAALSNGTYAAFVVLTFLGGGVAALLKDPATMIRTDGSRVVVPVNTTWVQELKGLYVVLRSDPYIILLFPMFFASNFFYTWQFNDFNGEKKTEQTNTLYCRPTRLHSTTLLPDPDRRSFHAAYPLPQLSPLLARADLRRPLSLSHRRLLSSAPPHPCLVLLGNRRPRRIRRVGRELLSSESLH